MATAQRTLVLAEISLREKRAIYTFHSQLMDACACEIDIVDATAHWLSHYAANWREADHLQAMAMQRQAIETHKWIRSQQVGYDLGREAVHEWISLYAKPWRDWYEREYKITFLPSQN